MGRLLCICAFAVTLLSSTAASAGVLCAKSQGIAAAYDVIPSSSTPYVRRGGSRQRSARRPAQYDPSANPPMNVDKTALDA